MREMGRITKQKATLMQGLANQRDITLLEIPYASMNQLSCAAGGSFGEIRLFHQQGSVPARRGLQRRAEARCATPDYQAIPDRRSI
jgi:hypothetical protein